MASIRGYALADELRSNWNSQRRRIDSVATDVLRVHYPSATAWEVINLAGVPQVGSISATYPGLRCLAVTPRLNPDQDDEWLVNIDWGPWPTPDVNDETEAQTPPWQKPDKFSSSTEYVNKLLAKDTTGAAIQNTVFQRIPYEHATPRRIYTLQRASLSWTEQTADDFVSSVNDAAVTIAGISRAAQTLLMLAINADENEWDNQGTIVPYWDIVYQIRFDPDKHLYEPLNEGTSFKLDAPDLLPPYIWGDLDPKEKGLMKNLDVNGYRISPGDPEHYLSFKVNKEMDWTPLGFT